MGRQPGEIEIMAHCTCCDEREAHPLCDDLCIECARPQVCACGRELTDDDAAVWSPENQIDCRCERCGSAARRDNEIDAMCRQVEQAAARDGWARDGYWTTAGTGSMYITLTRADRSITVRVSDHGSAYCREDVSLVIPSGRASGDDHTWAYLEARLA
jgi:hypothetical protein